MQALLFRKICCNGNDRLWSTFRINHVLPTNMTSKYSSGLSVSEFIKKISYINLSKKGIESLGPSVITLANYEGLAGHAQSVKKRIRRK